MQYRSCLVVRTYLVPGTSSTGASIGVSFPSRINFLRKSPHLCTIVSVCGGTLERLLNAWKEFVQRRLYLRLYYIQKRVREPPPTSAYLRLSQDAQQTITETHAQTRNTTAVSVCGGRTITLPENSLYDCIT